MTRECPPHYWIDISTLTAPNRRMCTKCRVCANGLPTEQDRDAAQAADMASNDEAMSDNDIHGPITGVVVGVLIGTVAWLVIGAVVFLVLR